MQTDERLEKDFFPKLREKITDEFQATQFEDSEPQLTKRKFIIRVLVTSKNLVENFVAFLLTMAFFIPLWMFKIGLNILDLVERWIRFVIWVYLKVIILIVNFIFKLLTFLKITSAVNFIKKVVKTYLGTYTVEDTEKEAQSALTKQNPKEHELIDVKKVEKKIRTPNIFLSHEQTIRPTFLSSEREEYRERINQDLISERTVQQNIVETSHRIKNPILTGLTESHQRLKRVATEPRTNTSASMQIQIPPLNRENTTPLSKSHRVEPDRDVSPSFYKQGHLKVADSSFKKKETPEKQILLTHHHPITQGTETQKHELQIQLLNLRTKMSELINANNKDIHDLQKWIHEKSVTITMTRKENMELLEQIQELQKENVKKTQAFAEFQKKIQHMEKVLEKERNLKNGLNEKVQKLEEEIKVKTIQIMSLKQKIRTNFEHLQRMESIFGNQKADFEKSPFKEDYPLEMQSPQANSKSLIADLDSKDHPNEQFSHQNRRSEYEVSNRKTIGQSLNEQEIEEPSVKVQVGSEKQIVQVSPFGEDDAQETKSTSAIQQHVEQNLEEKIFEEKEIVDRMIHKVEETLKNEEAKLQKFEHEKSTLLEQVLEKPKYLKEPIFMHEEKPASWIKQDDEKPEEAEIDKEGESKEQGDKKRKRNKKKR